MKKKIISLLTTLVMVVGLIGVMPVVIAGAETNDGTDFGEWEVCVGDSCELQMSSLFNFNYEAVSENDAIATATIYASGLIVSGSVQYTYNININGLKVGQTDIKIMIGDIIFGTIHVVVNAQSIDVNSHVGYVQELVLKSYTPENYHVNSSDISFETVSTTKHSSSVTINGNTVENVWYETTVNLTYNNTGTFNFNVYNSNDELIATIAAEINEIELGDINMDGKISTADVGLANAHAKGTKLLNDEQFKLADMNGDGKVTTADVGIINSYAKGTKN